MIAVSEIPTAEINRPVVKFRPGHAFECRVVITHKPDGIVAIAADFPDVGAIADTVNEALQQLASRLANVLLKYSKAGKIPWSSPPTKPQPGEMRIVVNIAPEIESSADLSERPFDVSGRDAKFVRELRTSSAARPKTPLDDPNLTIEE